MTKDNKCAYQSNKCNTNFLLVLQYFNWKFLVSAIYCHNPLIANIVIIFGYLNF